MSTEQDLQPLRIVRKDMVARDICLFELQAPDAAPLPHFTAGAHLAFRVPSGAMRQYSLCNDPQETRHYQIAVKRDDKGRGGSRSLVDETQVGDTLMAGPPQNLFALNDKAKSFILIAGGIGITPMKAMVHELLGEGLRKFRLFYFTRDPDGTAFLSELKALGLGSQIVVHHDHGDPQQSYDLWPVLEKFTGAHVYCCGPKPLMETVKDMTGHWPSSAVHFESFGADTAPHPDDTPFKVVLQRSGKQVEVLAQQSILEALRQRKIRVPSSCESGTCGSCKVGLLEGEADHRDLVLSDEDKPCNIMVCVSRAKTPTLVLDL